MARNLAQIRAHFTTMPFADRLGVEVVQAGGGQSVVRLPLSPQVAWNDDAFAGAFVGLLADLAGGAAVLSVLPVDQVAMTMAVDFTLTGSTAGQVLRAEGQVASHNGNTVVCTAVVYAEQGDTSTSCGVALVSIRATAPRTA